jgi:putative ABC transport system permease protein
VRGLSPLAWRGLLARRVRSALTIAGIALGVGVLYAALATNAGIDASVERTVRDMVGRADLRVAAFSDRGLAAATVDAIRGTPGVAVAAPAVERRTYLQAAPTATTPRPPVTVLGIDPGLDPRVHDLAIVAGSALARPDEPSALITERLSRDDGIGLGAEIVLQGAGAPTPLRVIGIIAGDGPLVGAIGRIVVVPMQRALETFALDGPSRVDLVLAPGASATSVTAVLEQRLTTEPYVLSSPADLAASLRASTADFLSTVALVAAVALFVGAFLIFNTLSMTVVERLRELGLLRAAGTTRRQIVVFVLTGAVVLGVAGSLLGVLVGIVLSIVIASYVGAVGSVPLGALEVPITGIALAFTVGVLVTVAAALEPAVRAGGIAPVEALKARLEPGGQAARLRWLIGVFVIVGAVGVALWPGGIGDAGAIRSIAVYGLLLAVTLASPFVLSPLGRLAGLPFSRLARLEERLARSALVRDRSRTALTVGALTVGLAMIVALGGVAQNARAAATAWLGTVIPGDEVVTSIRPVGLDEGVTDELAAVPGVQRVSPIATFDAAYKGVRVDAAAIVGADFAADGRLGLPCCDGPALLAGLDTGGVTILPRSAASRFGLAVGDTMAFAVAGGETVSLRVAAIVERSLPGRTGEAILVGWKDATERFGVTGADFFAVRFEPGATPTQRAALENAARLMALEPNPLDRVEGAISDALGRVFGLFDALAIVAVIVAALGIINTLTMNVFERVREIGVLRAVGMTRPQVARMVVVEAGVLGLVGAFLGILTGVAAGALMVALAGGPTVPGVVVPWPSMGLAAVLGIAVAMIAAYYPARVASGLSIVRAVQAD